MSGHIVNAWSHTPIETHMCHFVVDCLPILRDTKNNLNYRKSMSSVATNRIRTHFYWHNQTRQMSTKCRMFYCNRKKNYFVSQKKSTHELQEQRNAGYSGVHLVCRLLNWFNSTNWLCYDDEAKNSRMHDSIAHLRKSVGTYAKIKRIYKFFWCSCCHLATMVFLPCYSILTLCICSIICMCLWLRKNFSCVFFKIEQKRGTMWLKRRNMFVAGVTF